MKRDQPEQQIQIACANYLRLMLPADAFFTSLPAGGGGRLRGAFMKAMGYRAGTPDMFIVYGGKFHGIEFKAVGKYASPAQRLAAQEIIFAGACVLICHSIDELQQALRLWGIPSRLRIAA